MAKNTKPVPDVQAIPGIKGPKSIAEVDRALKLKVMGVAVVMATLSLRIPRKGMPDIERTYKVPVRVLTSPNEHSFIHAPTFAELRNANGKVAETDSLAIELYQDFKGFASGRPPVPTLTLPKEIAEAQERLMAQVRNALTPAQRADLDAGTAYLNPVPGGFKLSYKRKSKKDTVQA